MINQWFNNTSIKKDITILIIGQSNAGDINSVGGISPPNVIAINYPNVNYISYSNNTAIYAGTKNLSIYDRSSGSFGIDLGFISKLPRNKKINLIKFFFGSKGLKQQGSDADFNPLSSGDLYDIGIYKGDGSGFCEQIVNEHKLHVDFIVWVQGEQDAVISSQTYESDLELLTTQLRLDFDNQNLIFIYNQLHQNFCYYDGIENAEPGKTYVRNGQAAFNDNEKNKMITIDDITIGDIYNTHFNADASVEIGYRIGTYVNNRL